mmetsp:Transcript_133967/g.317683  ORF Transcript_133967/g.317683 Transcript_133967/m.317683 type:complete len:202 (+) Transcript_133967:1919-2524(+)
MAVADLGHHGVLLLGTKACIRGRPLRLRKAFCQDLLDLFLRLAQWQLHVFGAQQMGGLAPLGDFLSEGPQGGRASWQRQAMTRQMNLQGARCKGELCSVCSIFELCKHGGNDDDGQLRPCQAAAQALRYCRSCNSRSSRSRGKRCVVRVVPPLQLDDWPRHGAKVWQHRCVGELRLAAEGLSIFLQPCRDAEPYCSEVILE